MYRYKNNKIIIFCQIISIPIDINIFVGQLSKLTFVFKMICLAPMEISVSSINKLNHKAYPKPLPKEGAFKTPLPLGKGLGMGFWLCRMNQDC
jgi:hypothetical protein